MALITLTSDIGWKDYLVGAIKGRLMSLDEGFNPIDISHRVTPYNLQEAAYICSNSCFEFPDYTFHIILVNLFDIIPDYLLLAYHKKHYFLGADNSLIPMILKEQPETVIKLPMKKSKLSTLDCIDVMGKAIKKLSNGEPIYKLGDEPESIQERLMLKSRNEDDWLEAKVIHIDNFENVIVDLTEKQFEHFRKGREFTIFLKRDEKITQIHKSYAHGKENERIAIFNAAGYLEIAIVKGNAGSLFGLQTYKESKNKALLQSRLFYENIRIVFY